MTTATASRLCVAGFVEERTRYVASASYRDSRPPVGNADDEEEPGQGVQLTTRSEDNGYRPRTLIRALWGYGWSSTLALLAYFR